MASTSFSSYSVDPEDQENLLTPEKVAIAFTSFYEGNKDEIIGMLNAPLATIQLNHLAASRSQQEGKGKKKNRSLNTEEAMALAQICPGTQYPLGLPDTQEAFNEIFSSILDPNDLAKIPTWDINVPMARPAPFPCRLDVPFSANGPNKAYVRVVQFGKHTKPQGSVAPATMLNIANGGTDDLENPNELVPLLPSGSVDGCIALKITWSGFAEDAWPTQHIHLPDGALAMTKADLAYFVALKYQQFADATIFNPGSPDIEQVDCPFVAFYENHLKMTDIMQDTEGVWHASIFVSVLVPLNKTSA